MLVSLGLVGFTLAFAGYLVLALIYVLVGRWGWQGYGFLLATLLTAGWAGMAAAGAWWPQFPPYLADLLHHLSSLAWILFLWLLLAFSAELQNNYPRRIRLGWAIIAAMTVLVVGFDLVDLLRPTAGPSAPAIAPGLLISVAGLSLTETVFRSFRKGDRWSIKYLCLAVGGMFAYDIFFLSDALLYRTVDETLREVRGFVVVLLIPLIVVNMLRAESRHLALSLSAQMIFGSTVFFGTGIYLGMMSIAAYYIRDYGGTWSQALQIIFVFLAILVLCIALLSGTLRSFLRRFIAEHFQKQKFDYRQEWRRLVQQISAGESGDPLDLRVVKTLADLLDSPAGALWYLEGNSFSLATNWNILVGSITGNDAEILLGFFDARETMVDLQAYPENSADPSVKLRTAFCEVSRARFLLPLFHHDKLMGLILLTEPRAPRNVDHEDIELVTMASRQAAGYLSEQHAARSMAEARQFERFNRRYAFVTHDIKNLVSQLSLVVRNFEKFGDRPDFQRDMLATVQSAVERMNHLMERLSSDTDTTDVKSIDVRPLIEKVIEEQKLGHPTISFECAANVDLMQVRADTKRVDTILRHLLQNALETAGSNGQIVIGLRREKDFAVIEVRDSGKGMDPEFVQNELFRPFRSTKSGGMGIGAYQCRAYARELGGDLVAISSVGAGTTMRVMLPLLHDA